MSYGLAARVVDDDALIAEGMAFAQGVAKKSPLAVANAKDVLQSLWAQWETSPPDFIANNPWTKSVFNSLGNASAIAPTPLAVLQFDTARPEWIKYLSGEEPDAKTAMQKAQDAARAVYDQNVTAAPAPPAAPPPS